MLDAGYTALIEKSGERFQNPGKHIPGPQSEHPIVRHTAHFRHRASDAPAHDPVQAALAMNQSFGYHLFALLLGRRGGLRGHQGVFD